MCEYKYKYNNTGRREKHRNDYCVVSATCMTLVMAYRVLLYIYTCICMDEMTRHRENLSEKKNNRA